MHFLNQPRVSEHPRQYRQLSLRKHGRGRSGIESDYYSLDICSPTEQELHPRMGQSIWRIEARQTRADRWQQVDWWWITLHLGKARGDWDQFCVLLERILRQWPVATTDLVQRRWWMHFLDRWAVQLRSVKRRFLHCWWIRHHVDVHGQSCRDAKRRWLRI